jgi:hypothetical protein
LEGEDVTRVEAGIDAANLLKAAEKETGSSKESDGKRDLYGD